jgi:hypothetical protein
VNYSAVKYAVVIRIGENRHALHFASPSCKNGSDWAPQLLFFILQRHATLFKRYINPLKLVLRFNVARLMD